MNVEKYIANIITKTEKKIEELRREADEAYMNWADTGYQRYTTKKEKLENEAEVLESFIRPENDKITRKLINVEAENERLRMLLKSVQNIVECDMKYDFPDCSATRQLENVVNEFKFKYLKR